MGQEASEQ